MATNETNRSVPEAGEGKAAKTEEAAARGAAKGDGLALLKQQHRDIESALGESAPGESAPGQTKGDPGGRLQALCRAWVPHAMIEEELVFSGVDPSGADGAPFRAGDIQRDVINLVLADAIRVRRDGEAVEARLSFLDTAIRAAMAAEEKAGDGLYARAGKAGVDIAALAPRIGARAEELKRDAEADSLEPPEPRSLRLQDSGRQQAIEERTTMARRDMPERDERGRFMSDDDDRDYRRGRYSSGRDEEGRFASGNGGGRGRDEEGRFSSGGGRMRDEEGRFTSGGGGRGRDEEGRFGSGGGRGRDEEGRFTSGGGGRGRDEEGRFTSSRGRYGRDGDDRGYRSSGSRRDDDDRRYSRSRDDDDRRYSSEGGQGGWFGDPEGHSRASREGWDHRGRDDDDRRSSRSRDYDDGDDRRYSSDRGQGGWFGDPEGHSRASREGWDHRGRDDDDDRRYARSRDYDDDDDRRGSRGHGGWFGDPRGHSQASRRGWEGRR